MRLLVIEDETALRERLKQQFAGAGFRVDVAEMVRTVSLRASNYPLDTAIVNIELPKRTGFGVIRSDEPKTSRSTHVRDAGVGSAFPERHRVVT